MLKTPFGVKLAGLGTSTPSKVVSNSDLESILDTNDDWIKSRTGISERRVCDTEKGEDCLTLSVEAAKQALGSFPPEDLDLIIVATSTPDFLYPSVSCRLQNALGAKNVMAFDLSAACTGFIFALVTASQFVQLGT
ncbi:MAG TPA: 3-oxoacyl-ACP synthase, partial [Vampirovibrionales bacterium]